MAELVAPLAAAAIGRQQALHRAHRAEVAALAQQRGVHRRRRRVGKAFTVHARSVVNKSAPDKPPLSPQLANRQRQACGPRQEGESV